MSTAAFCQHSGTASSNRRSIRLLTIIEANKVTGPAKNLLDFCRITRHFEVGAIVETSILIFQRVGLMSRAVQLTNEFTEEALRDGIQVHCIAERFAFDPLVIRSLKEIVDRLAPDIIQTHGLKSHFLVRVCGAHKGRAWVAFHHGYTSTTYRRELLNHLDRWSLRAPSQVVTVSKAFAQQLSYRGVPNCRIQVVHNAIDPNWLESNKQGQECLAKEMSNEAPIVAQAKKLVLAVGRLSREKGFIDLIAAIRHLKDMRPENSVRLVIVGEGPERHALVEAVRSAGLDEQVQLVGHVKDVRPFYRAADVLAIPSLSEGSPNALLEAMAAGVPVVATTAGGIPEIVTDTETALLVSPRDPVALAMAIDRLLDDRSLADTLACRARRLIETHYSPVARAQFLVQLYERMSGASGSKVGAQFTGTRLRIGY